MEMACNNIARLVLPAVRISMAEQLSKRYDLSQEEIAKRLGIAQVAVSKYLNGRYSKSLKRAKNIIRSKGLVDGVVKKAAETRSPKVVNVLIHRLCTRIVSDDLVNL
jgi:predicted transcriptional regulator